MSAPKPAPQKPKATAPKPSAPEKRRLGVPVAFLSMSFLVAGLVGLFATYAAPIPLERIVLHDVVLDRALLATDPAALAAMRQELGDSAAEVIDGKGAIAERVVRARTNMRVKLQAEADDLTTRLRWMVVIVTIMAAAFGATMAGAGSRPYTPPAKS